MHEREVRIEGMTCQHCVLAVQKALNRVPGITLQVVRIGAVVYSAPDTERVLAQVRAAITEAGYTPA
jgi:copper chaperone